MSGSGAELLLLRVQESLFCVGLSEVLRIVPLPMLQPVPAAPPYLQGVLNLAGECVAVIDLARRLGIGRELPYNVDTPLLVCASGDERGALAIDEVLGVVAESADETQLAGLFAGGLPAFTGTVLTHAGPALRLDLARVLRIDLALPDTDLSFPEQLRQACRAEGAPKVSSEVNP